LGSLAIVAHSASAVKRGRKKCPVDRRDVRRGRTSKPRRGFLPNLLQKGKGGWSRGKRGESSGQKGNVSGAKGNSDEFPIYL